MGLLLDTHVLLWYITNSPKLSQAALALISNSQNSIYVSMASLWEVGIKLAIGKLPLHRPFAVLFPQQLVDNNFALLGIDIQHAELITRLPFHHSDPFDRMIAAQALVEHLGLISADLIFDQYGVTRFWQQ